MTGGSLPTDDNRSLRARLVQLSLFLSGCDGSGAVLVGDPFLLRRHAARHKINVMLSPRMCSCVDGRANTHEPKRLLSFSRRVSVATRL